MPHRPAVSPLSWFLLRPYTSGFLVFMLLSIISGLVILQRITFLHQELQLKTRYALETASNSLHQSLAYSMTATQALSFIIDNEGKVEDFDSSAAAILSNNPYISALQLVPNGVIKYIYPMQGNEAAMGYDILHDAARKEEALMAIQRRQLYFAGPFNLKQGGRGIIGRLPVYRQNKFWGFSAVVIKQETLLEAAGINDGEAGGFYFQLSKINPDTGQQEFYLPQSFDAQSSLAYSQKLEEGDWLLTAFPAKKTPFDEDLLRMILVGVIFCLLSTVLIIELLLRPQKLQKQVNEKTRQLYASEKRNKAIVNTIPDLMFVMDTSGLIIDFNNPMHLQTYYTAGSFIGKNIYEILPEEIAAQILQKIQLANESNVVGTLEYTLPYTDGIHHFEARFISSAEEEVLAIVRDITARKNAESNLKVREAMLTRAQEIGKFGSWEWRAENDQNIWSKELYDLMEIDPSQQISSEFFLQMVHPEDRLRIRHSISDAMEITGEYAEEMRIITGTGKIKYLEASMHVNMGEDGRPVNAIGVVQDISERKKAEEELKQSFQAIKELSGHLQNIREEERAYIAREIHDELGQQLTVLKMDISWLNKKIPEDDLLAQQRLQNLNNMINHTVRTVRKIASDLRPSMLDDLGLDATMEWHAEEFGKRSGININMSIQAEDRKIPEKIATNIYRVFQEALTNVARHADATEINVIMSTDESEVTLEVTDNGKGFILNKEGNIKTLGLLGMQERIKMIGGVFHIESEPGSGTCISVIVPLKTTEA